MDNTGVGNIQEEARSFIRRRRRETEGQRRRRERVAEARGISQARQGRDNLGAVPLSRDRDALVTQARRIERPRLERERRKRLKDRG